MGSFHSAEVRYVFGARGQLLPQPLSESELELSHAMMGYWYELTAKVTDTSIDGSSVLPRGTQRADLPAQGRHLSAEKLRQ